jgi:hypothetical protein
MKRSPKKNANRVGQAGRKDFAHHQGNTRSKAAPGARTKSAASTATPMPDTLENNDSYSSAEKYCACIEFHLSEHKRRGFHSSQLIEYTLEPNSHAEDDKNEPPQKLSLASSTADVVILGWWLGRLADKLRENKRRRRSRPAQTLRPSGTLHAVRVLHLHHAGRKADVELSRNSPKQTENQELAKQDYSTLTLSAP